MGTMPNRTDLYRRQAAYCARMAAKASKNDHRVHWLDMSRMWFSMADCISVLSGSPERQLLEAD